MIAQGEVDLDSVRDRMAEKYTPEQLDEIAEMYMAAYRDSGMTVEEAWEEMVCDSLGEMNIFEGTLDAAAGQYAEVLQEVKTQTEATKKEGRGPPAENINTIKMSRDAEISFDDIEVLREMDSKSINEFTPEEIKKTEKWARKFYAELGEKSPFFRAWFGDWRAYDTQKIKVVSVPTLAISETHIKKGTYKINDTNWDVYAGNTLKNDTQHHSGGNRINVKSLNFIDEILENGILLDTIVSQTDKKKKSKNTAFLHKIYTLITYENRLYIAKTTIEEYYNESVKGISRRGYNLKAIKIESAGGQLGNESSPSVPGANSIFRIADLYEFVKRYDKDFSFVGEANPLLLNEDGTPKKWYHQTATEITEFDLSKQTNSVYDSGTPNGIFLKSSDKDIGLQGKNQMELYPAVSNTLQFKNREEANEWYQENIPGYKEVKNKIDEIDRIYEKKYTEQEEKADAFYFDNYDAVMSGAMSEEEFARGSEEGLDEILTEWKEKSNAERGKARNLLNDYFKNSDYDSIYLKYDAGSHGRETDALIVFDKGNVKSATGNIGTFDKSNPDIRFSREETDSLGNQLSEQQMEYFADSKVRDSDGKLKMMYRGGNEEFTVFDRKKSKYSNLYGRGFYFTDSESHAKQYGAAKEYYLNIINPVSTTESTISKQQLKKFLEAVAENEDDFSFENYGYGATVESVLTSVYSKERSDFNMLYDVSQTAIGDMVATVELFNEVNGTNFDGLILDTETVAFYSEQIKEAKNKKPTTNPDVRFSREETSLADLRKENTKLRAQVEYWRDQTKVTDHPTLREGDVKKAAGELLQDYESTLMFSHTKTNGNKFVAVCLKSIFSLSEQYQQELGYQNDGKQSNGIGCCISRSHFICTRNADEGAQRRCGGHTAGDGTEVIEQAEFKHIFSKEITNDHGNEGHYNAIEEVDSLEVFNKLCTACNTCTNEEEHKTKLTENFQHLLVGGYIDGTKVCKVTKYKSGDECTTCGCEGEGVAAESLTGERNFNAANKDTDECGKCKCCNTDGIDIDELTLVFLLLIHVNRHKLCALFFHVCFCELGNELYEENNTNNTEEIGNTMTNCNGSFVSFHLSRIGSIEVLNSSFCCRESGSCGECAGENTIQHGHKFLRIILKANTYIVTANAGKRAGENDNNTEENVGFIVFLQVFEEVGSCNETNRGYKEDKTNIFNNFKCLCAVGNTICNHKSRFYTAGEECAENKSYNEYACGSKGNAFNCNTTKKITKSSNDHDRKHEERDAADGNNAAKNTHFSLSSLICSQDGGCREYRTGEASGKLRRCQYRHPYAWQQTHQYA